MMDAIPKDIFAKAFAILSTIQMDHAGKFESWDGDASLKLIAQALMTAYQNGYEDRGKSQGKGYPYIKKTVLPYKGSDCLIWPFAKRHGYGTFNFGGKAYDAHRFVCQEIHGPPPTPAHQAAHSCGKGHEGCVNPRHLSWKTLQQNKDDELIHGTRARGERHGRSKLTEADVREIRMKASLSQAAAAKLYGVSAAQIFCIRSGRSWAWLE